jgi:sugar phosphate isomerase/epimerase
MITKLPDMRIGALTACAPNLPLEHWMKEAKGNLDGLEIAAFQTAQKADITSGARKDWVASTLDLSEPLTPEQAQQIVAMSKEYAVAVHALGSYDNQLHTESGEKNRAHLRKVIDAAALLRPAFPESSGPLVATFVGASPELRLQENYARFKSDFIPLVAYAKDKGVRLMIENCPMEGWEKSDRPVNNLMSAPGYWIACFKAANEAGVGDALGLEYDPSHRIWQTGGRMDLVAKDLAVFGSQGKVFALHGKGAGIKDDEFWKWGVDGKLIDLGENEWGKRPNYEHAVPGESYDSVGWKILIPMARGFRIPLVTIEIEDPRYKDMTDPERSGTLGIQAVHIGRRNLASLCYEDGLSFRETV